MSSITLALYAVGRLVSDYQQSAWDHSTVITFWLFLGPALRAHEAPRWKVFFWSLLLIGLFRGLDTIALVWVGGMRRVIFVEATCLWSVVLLLGCVWIDRQVPLRRPWTHWAGVLAFLWGNSVHAISLGLYASGSYFGWGR